MQMITFAKPGFNHVSNRQSLHLLPCPFIEIDQIIHRIRIVKPRPLS